MASDFSDVDWAAFNHLSLSDIGCDADDVGNGGDGTNDAGSEIQSTSPVDPFPTKLTTSPYSFLLPQYGATASPFLIQPQLAPCH